MRFKNNRVSGSRFCHAIAIFRDREIEKERERNL